MEQIVNFISYSRYLLLRIYQSCKFQVVYNANKLAKLVEKKKGMQNWLTYYQTKYERDPTKRPKTKVMLFVLKFADLLMLLSVSKASSYPYIIKCNVLCHV